MATKKSAAPPLNVISFGPEPSAPAAWPAWRLEAITADGRVHIHAIAAAAITERAEKYNLATPAAALEAVLLEPFMDRHDIDDVDGPGYTKLLADARTRVAFDVKADVFAPYFAQVTA